jgi:hypothetical protein
MAAADSASSRTARSFLNLRHDTVEDGNVFPGGESAYA